MNNLKIITLTKLELSQAISENKYWNGVIEPPLSKNKAKWLVENKRAADDDVLAVLGYENNTIIGFVHMIPDFVKIDNGNTKKIFWSQKWWVSDKYKGTLLPAYIKKQSLGSCFNQLIVRFLGDNTRAYYKKQPFTQFSERKRYIIVFSLDHKLLIYKKSGLKKIKALLKVIDSLSRRVLATLNILKSKLKSADVTYSSVNSVSEEVWQFLEKHLVNDLVPKSKEYINWQITNKQYHLLNKGQDKLDYKCLLGTISKKIYNINFVVKNDDVTVGFISGFVSGNRFIVRYFIYEESYYDDCLNVLMKALIDSKCTILQTENYKVGEGLSNKYFKVYVDSKELLSLIHNDVNINIDDSMVFDQDGSYF